MSLFNIKKWPEERRKKFSIFLALILTVLVLFFSFYLDALINKITEREAVTSEKSNVIDSIKDFLKANIKTQ